MPTNYFSKGAQISRCELYRFSLSRVWDLELPACTFIGLNPSTADADLDDPTIRRCVAFAASWGCGELIMVNLFPYRSTSPAGILGIEYPADVVQANDDAVAAAIARSKYSIAAWGNLGTLRDANKRTLERYRNRLHYLRLNRGSDEPAHPLYLPCTLTPIPFTEASDA